MEQGDYLADWIVQVNAPVLVRPAVLTGQLRPAQDKGVQYLRFIGQGCECGGFKKEIRKPGKADRLFRLMNINRACHSVFCGRLEARFPRKMILHTTRPGYELAKPDKSRLFFCLTVHSRPPFPFTFCFLPPVNSGGTVGTVFRPVGLWDEHSAADRTAFQVLIPENLRLQCPVQRQDRPAEPLTADRERNRLRTGAGVPIVKGHTVPVLITAALPADQGVCLFPLCRCHAVKGTVLPALYGRQSFIWVLSHVFPPFFLSRSPRKGFLPHSCGVFRRWHAPRTSGYFVPKWLVAVLPLSGYPFRTVIQFSRYSSSMNYPKSTPKRPPAPYIHKVGNQPGKLSISTLSELW